MSKEFKFNVGDEVDTASGRRGVVQFNYKASTHSNWYIIVFDDRFSSCFGEMELTLAPKKPLDSNGVEIEVGDLVINSTGTVAKVRAIKLDHSFPIRVFELKFKSNNGYTIKGTTILEKASKKTITLGSLVRVKETGEEFRVIKGELGDRNFKCWTREISWEEHRVYKEYKLELIG